MAKSNYYLDAVSLNHADYTLCLPSGLFVAAYLEKILVGFADMDQDTGKMMFHTKKTIIIPSASFFQFVKTIKKAYQALKTGSTEEFEDLIYCHNNTHFLVSKFQSWNEQMGLSLFYKWKFTADQYFQNQVQMGQKEPVDVSKLVDPEFQPLKRGVYNLKLDEIETLANELDTILHYTYLDSETNKQKVFEFVDYVSTEERHKSYLIEKMETYSVLRQADKIAIIEKMLTAFLDDKGKEYDAYEYKMYLDLLRSKVDVLFSLLKNNLE